MGQCTIGAKVGLGESGDPHNRLGIRAADRGGCCHVVQRAASAVPAGRPGLDRAACNCHRSDRYSYDGRVRHRDCLCCGALKLRANGLPVSASPRHCCAASSRPRSPIVSGPGLADASWASHAPGRGRPQAHPVDGWLVPRRARVRLSPQESRRHSGHAAEGDGHAGVGAGDADRAANAIIAPQPPKAHRCDCPSAARRRTPSGRRSGCCNATCAGWSRWRCRRIFRIPPASGARGPAGACHPASNSHSRRASGSAAKPSTVGSSLS